MLIERLYDEDLAQASYVIGCQATGEALVVDPRRDVQDYLDLTTRHGLRITAVTETHVHADYLSGTREVAHATGAQLYVSGEGGEDWQYGFEATRLHDGDQITVGNITVRARHTPGHTPEHLVFVVTDGAFSDSPGFLLSGDLVFSGDLGRPDLLDEAAAGADTRFEGARQTFRSLREVFLGLPDHVQVFPAHGAGSACGKSLGALPSTTVGYERLNAWWGPYLTDGDEEGFIAQLLDGQPDAHSYFARMKRENKGGPRVLGDLPALRQLEGAALATALEAQEVVLLDTRHHSDVHRGTVAGSLAVPGPAKTASYGAWAYDPDTEQRPLVALVPDLTTAEEVRSHLVRVGIDTLTSFTTTLDGLPITQPAVVSPADLDAMPAAYLVDVRNRTEHESGSIPGSSNLSAGRMLWHLDELPRTGTVITYCQSGVRNAVAASALRRAGFDVAELDGSYAAWASWQTHQHETKLQQ